MTDEQFAALAQFEDRFRTAIDGGWCRYPGLAALQTMASVLGDVTGRAVRINAGCSRCVLHTVQDTGRAYFAEKARREAVQAANAEKVSETPAKKKRPEKRKETTRNGMA